MCNHIRYHHDRVHEIMPKDTVYISILREPGGLFQSTFHYYFHAVPEFWHVTQNGHDSVEKWLDHASEYWNPNKVSVYVKNHLMFELGFESKLDNQTEIEAAIRTIDERFDLMLIFDHMEESLVLLADLLGCSLKDVLSVKLNARKKPNYTGKKGKRISEKARRWIKADAALFDYFNKTLWRKVEEYGFDRMRKDVEALQTINHEITTSCISSEIAIPYRELKNVPWKNNIPFQPKGVTITGFDLKPEAEKNATCVDLISPEPYLSSKVFQKQKQRSAHKMT